MDANGLRMWQVADGAGFGVSDPARSDGNLQWQEGSRLLRLRRNQPAPALSEDETLARSLADRPSLVADRGGGWAWWDGGAGLLKVAGFGAGANVLPLPTDDPPGLPQPTDLAFDSDDILYVARNDAVLLIDRRDRFPPARAALAGFRAQRLAPAAGGGAWSLDRTSGQIALLSGRPLRSTGFDPGFTERFHPVEPNPSPPRLRRLKAARLPAGTQGIALAGSLGGRLAVLAWTAGGAEVWLLRERTLVRAFALEGLRFPYGLAWIGEDRIAILATSQSGIAPQAYVYETDNEATARPTGEVYPLRDPFRGSFANILADTPAYGVAASGDPTTPTGLRRLLALSRPSYARSGITILGPLDSGKVGCVWHRAYVEAAVPDHAGVRLWMFADDRGGLPAPPGAADAPDWSPHLIGLAAALPDRPDAPVASWCDEASEVPFDPGYSPCRSAAGRSGLFTMLAQRAGKRVRRIEGRWLYLAVEMVGDSLVSPEVAAVRIYGERASYRDRYLPAFYRELLAGPDADAAGPATPQDFLDRFLGLFEGPLTQLEDKVAGSWLLTDPAATPASALPWLGRWIGIDATPGEADRTIRQRLCAAPWTATLHGSLGGLLAAIEIATGGQLVRGGQIDPAAEVPRPGSLALVSLEDLVARALVLGVNDPASGLDNAVLVGGAVTRGEIVVVEGYRLRRSWATILGADLADEDDPLTLGLVRSGNSFVGDTLFLGDETRREFMALFGADLPQSQADKNAVDAFFERLAFRTLVLVRDGAATHDLARLQAIASAEAPAHVEVSVLPASRPLIVGAASLVGVDTFLVDKPAFPKVRIDRTRIGLGDQIAGDGRLDARSDGPGSARPIAVADGPAEVLAGRSFLLSAARSHAVPGRTINRNIWMWT